MSVPSSFPGERQSTYSCSQCKIEAASTFWSFDLALCCLHAGHGNTGVNYDMGGSILCQTVKENDLGVTINANMKVSEQCRIAASKGNQILGMIRRNITYKEKGLIVPLYKAIVRPHLEYCIQAWRPYLRKDIATCLKKYKGEQLNSLQGLEISATMTDWRNVV